MRRSGSALIGLAAALAVVEPRAVVLVGVAAAAAGAEVAWRRRRTVDARWSRGWWVLGTSGLLLAAAVTPSLRGTVTGTVTILAALGAVLVGSLLAAPASSGNERLARLSQSGTVGALVAVAAVGLVVALGAELGTAMARHAAELFLAVTAWRVVRRSARVQTDGGGPAEGYLAAGLLLFAATRLLELGAVLPEVTTWAARGVAGGTAAALATWVLAIGDPRLHVPSPARVNVAGRLGRGELVLAASAASIGPLLVAARAISEGAVPLPLAVAALGPALPAMAHLVLLVRDRVERSERALHDPLTGLVTEPVFADRLERALAGGKRTGRGVAVAFLDLDGFKGINDTSGHDAGDEVLRAVASRLRETVRDEDTVARRSGDEFLVLLPGIDRAEDAERVAHKLADVVGDGIEVGAQMLRVGVSIGLAMWPRDADRAEELVRHADAAMYEAKGAAGDRVRWCSAATTARARITSQLRRELEAQIARDQLELALQPAVGLDDGRVQRLHALVRWHHPQLGTLTPRVFLPLLVDPAVARALDVAVLERAVSMARRWQQAGWLDVPVVVTLTSATATWPELPEVVARTLRGTGLPPDRLVLAVDEATVRTAGERFVALAADLADLGLGVLITQVGAGAIDLDRFAALPLVGLEVTPLHVGGHGLTGARMVLEAVAGLAAALGVPATAAGVIGPAAVETLRDVGYEGGRGSYLGAPQEVPELEALLAGLVGPGHDPRAVPGAALDSTSPPNLRDAGLSHTLSAILRSDGDAPDDEVDAILERLSAPDPVGV